MINALEDIVWDLDTAAYLAGVDRVRARNWIDQNNLFPNEGTGRGVRRHFAIQQVFQFAAVRALIEDAGLAATRAIAAVRPHRIYASFLENQPFFLSRNHETGGWIAIWRVGRVELHILPWKLWEEMRPRFTERLPEETAAFEKAIETLRACQETDDWSAMLQQPADPAIAASWEKVIAGLNADTRK